jgi:nitroreductase
METIQAIHERRSVKHYDPNFQLTEAEVAELIDLARLSPTSFNMQNWRFVVVQSPEQKAALCAAAWNQAQVRDAALVVVLCADLKAHTSGERYWRQAPKEAAEVLVPMIAPFYEGKPQLQRDEAMRSVGMAAQTLMLAAKAKGLDSCPMIGFDPVKVAELIHLPADHVVGMMLPIGKAKKPAWARPGTLPRQEVVFKETF